MLMSQQYFMLSIKEATTQAFLFFEMLRLVRGCKEFVLKSKNFSVKLFAYAKFEYRTVSNFNNTKLENLPDVKLLTFAISIFGLFCLFCQY